MSLEGTILAPRNIIHDSVLGGIPIFEKCDLKLLRLALLQRLRHIRQLPVASLVFPAADHSRFVHSLGAYYWAQAYAEQQALGFEKRERRLVRWGALLHDVGHYPCSHALESVYQRIPPGGPPLPKSRQITQALDSDLWENASKDPMGFVCWGVRPMQPGWAHHEHLGRYAIQQDRELDRIISSVDHLGFGKHDIVSILSPDPPPELAKFRQIFHSQVDVDRMDYLVRDSHVTGASYGLVEPLHIIRQAMLGTAHPDEDDEREVIAYRSEAVPRLDHFVLARYFHYSNLIYHNTVCGFELLLQAVVAALVSEGAGNLPPSYDAVKELCDDGRFVDFTDDTVYSAIRKRSTDADLIAEMARMLLRRIRPVTVHEARATRQKTATGFRIDPNFTRALDLFRNRERVAELAQDADIEPRRVGWTSWELQFDNLLPYRSPVEVTAEADVHDQISDTIWLASEEGALTSLPEHDGSVLGGLSDRSIVGLYTYYFSEEDDQEATERLNGAIAHQLTP